MNWFSQTKPVTSRESIPLCESLIDFSFVAAQLLHEPLRRLLRVQLHLTSCLHSQWLDIYVFAQVDLHGWSALGRHVGVELVCEHALKVLENL